MRCARLSGIAALLVALLLPGVAPATAAPASEPWSAAQTIRDRLFAARADALLHPERAVVRARAAARGLSGPLRRGLAEHARPELRELRTVLADARRAAAAQDPVALATASGRASPPCAAARSRSLSRRPARGVSARRGTGCLCATSASRRASPARRWTPPWRSMTSRPARSGRATAVLGVRKDLLDAYQARLRSYLDDARLESERGYLPAAAESAALAVGYWRISRPSTSTSGGRPPAPRWTPHSSA